jgi:uncharacterized protein (DUF1330 family)
MPIPDPEEPLGIVIPKQTIPVAWSICVGNPTDNDREPYRTMVGNGNWPIACSVAAVQLRASRRPLDEAQLVLGRRVEPAGALTHNSSIQVDFMAVEASMVRRARVDGARTRRCIVSRVRARQWSDFHYLERQMSATYYKASTDQIKAIQALDAEGPLIMLNMLRFRPDGGAEQYAEYVAAAAPFLAKAGAKINYAGSVHGTLIGPGDEDWDEILLVEYPSKAAFFEMTGDPDYPREIRSGALADSRLYTTQKNP